MLRSTPSVRLPKEGAGFPAKFGATPQPANCTSNTQPFFGSHEPSSHRRLSSLFELPSSLRINANHFNLVTGSVKFFWYALSLRIRERSPRLSLIRVGVKKSGVTAWSLYRSKDHPQSLYVSVAKAHPHQPRALNEATSPFGANQAANTLPGCLPPLRCLPPQKGPVRYVLRTGADDRRFALC